MADPTRDFPDQEIEFSLENWGGWFGWFGERPDEAIRALQWKASQGDELPEDLVPLRDAIAQFGHAPIEEAVARVQGLEKAFREVADLAGVFGDDGDVEIPIGCARQIREIVESCVEYSGYFGTGDPEPGDLIAAVNELRKVVGEPPMKAETDAEE